MAPRRSLGSSMHFVPRDRVRNGMVYVEWNRNPKPYIFNDAAELATIGRDYGFARNFSARKKEAYLSLLDRTSG